MQKDYKRALETHQKAESLEVRIFLKIQLISLDCLTFFHFHFYQIYDCCCVDTSSITEIGSLADYLPRDSLLSSFLISKNDVQIPSNIYYGSLKCDAELITSFCDFIQD